LSCVLLFFEARWGDASLIGLVADVRQDLPGFAN
jgi:hypothetical protein